MASIFSPIYPDDGGPTRGVLTAFSKSFYSELLDSDPSDRIVAEMEHSASCLLSQNDVERYF